MFNPSDFGITTEVSVANLVNARTQYEALVASLKGETTKPVVPKLDSTEDQNTADALISDMREMLFSTLDSSPIVSLVLVDALQAIVKDTKEFKAWFTADAARKGTAVPETDGGKETADKMKEFIGSLFNAAQAFKLELPTDFKVKMTKDGSIVPDLSRLPYTKGEATKKVGGYTLRYCWHAGRNDVEDIGANDVLDIPAGTFADEIAMRYISTPHYRISGSEMFDSLPRGEERITPTGQKRKGHLNMPKDGSSVYIQFETGVLEAWLPTDAPVEVESDEDDEEVEEDSPEE